MPNAATSYYSRAKLVPLYGDEGKHKDNVQIAPSLTLAFGTVLGEITATPGVYKAYASGNSDGSQVAKAILEYAVVTDASGNITLGAGSDFGITQPSVSVYLPNSGVAYNAADLVGLDAGALTALGGSLHQGTLTNGVVVI